MYRLQHMFLFTHLTLDAMINVRKKTNIRNRHNQVPHLTQDTIWESYKNTRKYHIQEAKEVNFFPAGDNKAAMNRQDSMTDTKHK